MKSSHQTVHFDCYLAVLLIGHGFTSPGCRQYLLLTPAIYHYWKLSKQNRMIHRYLLFIKPCDCCQGEGAKFRKQAYSC